MDNASLVSVIIPVNNRAGLLREAVSSVLSQNWEPIEVIIVDDGSTDETPDVANALANQYSGVVKVINRQNGGPGAARQTGVDASRGDFIQFLDSDDLLLPGKIRIQVCALLSDSAAGIAYGRTLYEVDGERRPSPENWSGEESRTIFPGILVRRFWDTSNPLYRRSTLNKVGPWAPRRQLEDWEYDCRAAAAGILLHYCDVDVNVHRVKPGERLSSAWVLNDHALRDRFWAFREVYRHAMTAGVDVDSAHFQSFVRTMFMTARLAGSRGMDADADELFGLVLRHARVRRLQLSVFWLAIRFFGWRRAVALGERVAL